MHKLVNFIAKAYDQAARTRKNRSHELLDFLNIPDAANHLSLPNNYSKKSVMATILYNKNDLGGSSRFHFELVEDLLK
jgi:hypothetical protein